MSAAGRGMSAAGDQAAAAGDGSATAGQGTAATRDGTAAHGPVRDVAARWPVDATAERGQGALVRLRVDQVTFPDGDVAGRDVVEHPGAVAVVALDRRDRVLMIRQYRHPTGRLLWEIPAGLRDADGEAPLATAERELLEETGYRARDWRVLTDVYTSPGILTERVRVFLARDLAPVPATERTYAPVHEEAHLVSRWVPLAVAVSGFLAGALHNGVTAVGILSAYATLRGDFAALRPGDAAED